MHAIQSASRPTQLPEMPINPEWIRAGAPRARGTIMTQSADKRVSGGLWECTAGKFHWTFGWDEFIHVLEGEVKITPEGGSPVTLKAGDTAHFPLGLKTEWDVPVYIRKSFTLRTPEPLNL